MSFPHFLLEMKKGTAPSGGVRQSTTGQIDLSISSFSKILENAPSEFRQGKPLKFRHLSDGIRRKSIKLTFQPVAVSDGIRQK